ncbi:MAG TPA: hypothetical protein VGS22_29110 [Thermoanaerobaculia bacterium]|jgi:hypothetical protein|nr:hypothetical protein [Thermoanaerobaculia bacterium]
MHDRLKSTADDENPYRWEDQSAFRRTFLEMFRPEDAAALERVGRLLFDCALAFADEWHPKIGSDHRTNLLAFVGDLRYMQSYLEDMTESCDREEEILSRLAVTQARAVAKIANTIDAGLEARG